MLCNLLVILKIENVRGAKYVGGEVLGIKRQGRNVPGAKCQRSEVTRWRIVGNETLEAKHP